MRQLLNLPDAPCYCELVDDGAPFRCGECREEGPASDMFYTLAPNGKRGVFHKTCLDTEWLDIAKKIPGKM